MSGRTQLEGPAPARVLRALQQPARSTHSLSARLPLCEREAAMGVRLVVARGRPSGVPLRAETKGRFLPSAGAPRGAARPRRDNREILRHRPQPTVMCAVWAVCLLDGNHTIHSLSMAYRDERCEPHRDEHSNGAHGCEPAMESIGAHGGPAAPKSCLLFHYMLFLTSSRDFAH